MNTRKFLKTLAVVACAPLATLGCRKESFVLASDPHPGEPEPMYIVEVLQRGDGRRMWVCDFDGVDYYWSTDKKIAKQFTLMGAVGAIKTISQKCDWVKNVNGWSVKYGMDT